MSKRNSATCAAVICSISTALLAAVPPGLAQQNASVCPDMADHEKLLREGLEYDKSHGGSGRTLYDPFERSGGTIHLRPLIPLMMDPKSPNRLTPGRAVTPDATGRGPWKQRTLSDFIPLTQSAHHVPSLQPSQIESLRLYSPSEVRSAELHALSFERAGQYDLARKVYDRILSMRTLSLNPDQTLIAQTKRDLNRVASCQAAQVHRAGKQFIKAIADYQDVLAKIEEDENLSFKNKLGLLDPIIDDLNKGWASSFDDAKLALVKADKMKSGYKKAMDCLNMAEQLNEAARSLERHGSYEMAEKLFQRSLSIKQSNLGVNHTDTLAEYLDLARICVLRSQYDEAQKIFEQALSSYRKLGNPGDMYVRMLENYGDMLAHQGNKSKADEIYDEARVYHNKH